MHIEEKASFKRSGFLIRRNLVDQSPINKVRQLILDWYEHEMDHSLIDSYSERTFAPPLRSHPEVLALFNHSAIPQVVSDLMQSFTPVETAQVQIRIPESLYPGLQPEKSMHVDGVSCPHLQPSELRTFSLLVGVVLSVIDDPRGGPLRYLPAGHLRMSNWFQSEWALGITQQTPPEVEATEGQLLLGDPGDVLFLHHLVPHSVGRNLTGAPRIMVYFRVSHIDHAEHRLEALRDPWVDYPPLASIPLV